MDNLFAFFITFDLINNDQDALIKYIKTLEELFGKHSLVDSEVNLGKERIEFTFRK